MLAQRDKIFEETCDTVFTLNQDDKIRYWCEAREEGQRIERTYQVTIAELKTENAELKTTNAELKATNAELKAANAELCATIDEQNAVIVKQGSAIEQLRADFEAFKKSK